MRVMSQITFAHEVIGHMGVNAVVGKNWGELVALVQADEGYQQPCICQGA